MAVAAELCRGLKSATARMVVAGSLRRGKAEVGDIEILYIPEIVEPRIIPYSTMANLIGASIVL